MNQTFVEKILAKNAGLSSVTPGQIIEATPDVALSHDNSAAIAKIFHSLGLERVKYPERLAIALDHAAPAPTTQHAQNHAEIRQFVAQQHISHFYDVGRGVCHQVLCEEKLIYPGIVLLGADSHSTHYGALGAFGAGIGRSEMAAIWATGQLWLRIPESIKITLHGTLPAWVTSKDVALVIIGQLGADGGLYASIEFHGEALATMSMESRFVFPNMMAEMGAKNAWVAQDEITFAWLNGLKGQESGHMEKWAAASRALQPDEEANYLAKYSFDVSKIEPQVACPHTVDNVKPLSEVVGIKIDQAFLGTCTNGRLEDIAIAAKIVAGKRVATNCRFIIIPDSSRIYLEAVKAGYVETLLEAGAMFESPGCGPCMGNHLGIPAPGEVTISTANRNFKGRMGTREAEVYLASPAVVAASAIAGKIIHPKELGIRN